MQDRPLFFSEILHISRGFAKTCKREYFRNEKSYRKTERRFDMWRVCCILPKFNEF